MKTYRFFFLASIFTFCACSQALSENESLRDTQSHKIELSDALIQLDNFLELMNQDTKATSEHRHYSVPNIETISSDAFTPLTKSDSDKYPDSSDLMYIVNFDDNMGSAVLAADDRLCDYVLCVTESGSLHKDDFSFQDFKRLADTKSAETDERVDGSGEGVVPLLLMSASMQSIIDDSEDISRMKPVTKALSTATKYGPYVKTKWNQTYVGIGVDTVEVFSRYTPNHYPAGCVVIAVAQILECVLSPFNMTINAETYKSSDMLTVANYASPSYPGTLSAQTQVGKFVYYLGSNSNLCGVTYAASGTSGDADGAKRALQSFMLTNVTKKTGFGSNNQTIATNQIRQGRPVYLSGKPEFVVFSGHAWVLDGEWGNYYHVNWGASGAHDGYFTKGLFDMTNRAGYDDDIDEYTNGRYSSAAEYYTWWYRMVTYSL